jgi:hypothetical protein
LGVLAHLLPKRMTPTAINADTSIVMPGQERVKKLALPPFGHGRAMPSGLTGGLTRPSSPTLKELRFSLLDGRLKGGHDHEGRTRSFAGTAPGPAETFGARYERLLYARFRIL